MNDAVWLKLLDQLPAIVTALGVIVGAYLSYRSNQQSKANAVKIEEVAHSVNGQSEKLLALTRVSSHAEGMKDESDAQTIRDTPIKVAIVENPVPVKVVEGEK